MKLFEMMDNDVREILLKIRKDSTGSINAAKLEKALAVLPGWKIEKQLMTVELDRSSPELKTPVRIHDKYKGTFDIESDNKEAVEGTYEILKALEVSKLPTTPKNKQHYVISVRPIKEMKYPGMDKVYYKFSFVGFFYGTKGYLVTAPNGETFKLAKLPQYNSIVFYDFWPWAKEKTSLKADVLTALGMTDTDTEKKEKARVFALSRENVAECQICSRVQKLTPGKKMVHHGYNRPGHGYIVGDCFGVGYQPYELGHDALDDYLPQLERMLDTNEKNLKRFKSGKVKSLSRIGKDKKVEIITPEHKAWKTLFDSTIHGLERDIRYIKQDIETVNKRIKNWELKPLPTTK